MHTKEQLQELQNLPLSRKIQITTARIIEWYQHYLDAPFKVSARCCDIMKKKPIKKYSKKTGRLPITATMASESISREAVWMRQGCNAFNNKSPISQPMSFWTENDVLEYLYTYKIPYASVYGDIVKTDKGWTTTGEKRTGCVFCAFGVHLEKLQTVSND